MPPEEPLQGFHSLLDFVGYRTGVEEVEAIIVYGGFFDGVGYTVGNIGEAPEVTDEHRRMMMGFGT